MGMQDHIAVPRDPCMLPRLPLCPQGERLVAILKHLFPVPKSDSKRVMTFSNDHDYISFRHHTYSKAAGSSDVALSEVSPHTRGSVHGSRAAGN